jgi:hypothetical protein
VSHAQTRVTEVAWRELIAQAYPDARPDEFETLDGNTFFRLRAGRDGTYVAAWLPAHNYGFVDTPAP